MTDSLSAPAAGCPRCVEHAEIIVQLQAHVAQLEAEVRDLRARLHLHSGNSSLPPSANPPSAPTPVVKSPTGRKPGGQPGHPGHHRLRLPPERVNQVIAHVPTCCVHCQGPLPAQASPNDPASTWHQVAELPEILAVVTEHQGQARTCPRGGHVTRGVLPAEVLAHDFGPRLTATVAFLSGRCHDSKRTVAEIVETVFGASLSLGSVVSAEQEMAAALAAPYHEARRV
jgi:transposase